MLQLRRTPQKGESQNSPSESQNLRKISNLPQEGNDEPFFFSEKKLKKQFSKKKIVGGLVPKVWCQSILQSIYTQY